MHWVSSVLVATRKTVTFCSLQHRYTDKNDATSKLATMVFGVHGRKTSLPSHPILASPPTKKWSALHR